MATLCKEDGMSSKTIDLNEKARELLELAQQAGVEQNYLFVTTFARYQRQIKILSDLEKEIATSEMIVTKEYVKGRKNVYVHPAITEYNKTADCANRTASTLMKVIVSLEDKTLSAGDDML